MTKTYDRVDADRLDLILESGDELEDICVEGILVRDLARTLEQDRKDTHEEVNSYIDEIRALELANGDLESQVRQLERDVADWKNAKGMATTAANDLAADNEKLFEQNFALLTRATGGVQLIFQVSGDVVVREKPEDIQDNKG